MKRPYPAHHLAEAGHAESRQAGAGQTDEQTAPLRCGSGPERDHQDAGAEEE